MLKVGIMNGTDQTFINKRNNSLAVFLTVDLRLKLIFNLIGITRFIIIS